MSSEPDGLAPSWLRTRAGAHLAAGSRASRRRSAFRSIRICSGTPAALSWPTMDMTRGRSSITSGTRTSRTRCAIPNRHPIGVTDSGKTRCGWQVAGHKRILSLGPRFSRKDAVRPAKAGAFCGSQSHRGRSRSPVAWLAGSRETEILKPTDDAIGRVAASHQAVAQANERWPRNFQPRRPSHQRPGEGSMHHRDMTCCDTRATERASNREHKL